MNSAAIILLVVALLCIFDDAPECQQSLTAFLTIKGCGALSVGLSYLIYAYGTTGKEI